MRCKYCNGVLEDNARFCRYCGKKLDAEPVAPAAPVYENTNVSVPYPSANSANGADMGNYANEPPQSTPSAPVNQSGNNPAPKKKGKPVVLIIIALLLIPGLLIGLLLIGIVTYFIIKNVVNKDKPVEKYEETTDSDANDDDDWYVADDTTDYNYDEWYDDTEYDDYDDYDDTTHNEEPEEVETTAPDTEEYREETTYADNQKVVIAHGGLRIRNKPDLTYGAIVGLIPNGTMLTVEKVENNWAYVCVDGVYGWCSCDFLFAPYVYSGNPIYIATANYYKGVDLTTEKHGTAADFYTIIPDGHTVYVYVIEGNRAFVRYNNIYGWCSTEHLVMQNLS